MDVGECQFTLLGVTADHPEWWRPTLRRWSEDVVESGSDLEVPGENR
jgi:hypothetical protein